MPELIRSRVLFWGFIVSEMNRIGLISWWLFHTCKDLIAMIFWYLILDFCDFLSIWYSRDKMDQSLDFLIWWLFNHNRLIDWNWENSDLAGFGRLLISCSWRINLGQYFMLESVQNRMNTKHNSSNQVMYVLAYKRKKWCVGSGC